jgi:crossover junction endodeoxyribonuclease RuvC
VEAAGDKERAVIVFAVDPGSVSAAWGIANEREALACGDVPVADRMIDAAGFADLVAHFPASVAVVEKVGAFPRQGVSSSFRFGMGTGIIHGVLAALVVRRVEVSPMVWKKHFRLGPDKEQARALALKLFSGLSEPLARKRDAGRAEALLMAWWYVETHK